MSFRVTFYREKGGVVSVSVQAPPPDGRTLEQSVGFRMKAAVTRPYSSDSPSCVQYILIDNLEVVCVCVPQELSHININGLYPIG